MITTIFINKSKLAAFMDLIHAGLTANESQIYLCILGEHDLSAGEITKKTGIHRRSVYDALDRLLEKGLVNSTLINNVKTFNAAHPSRLNLIIEEKKAKIDSLMPDLIRQFEFVEKRSFVKVFKGVQGAKTSFSEGLESMREGDEYRAMGCVDMAALLGKVFMKQHHEERTRKKIRSSTLFNHKNIARAKTFRNKKNYSVRSLPRDIELPVQTVIYGEDVVCQMVIHKEPFVVMVVDKVFAESCKKQFEVLWKISKDV